LCYKNVVCLTAFGSARSLAGKGSLKEKESFELERDT
jgi:hypothetical protein